METIFQDLRHAVRIFRQGGASFTLTAVLALGLGIGANTAIFSLVNTVLLKEPPFPKSDRIVIFETKTPQGSFQGASPAKFAHWAQQTQVVEDVSALGLRDLRGLSTLRNVPGGGIVRHLRDSAFRPDHFLPVDQFPS